MLDNPSFPASSRAPWARTVAGFALVTASLGGLVAATARPSGADTAIPCAGVTAVAGGLGHSLAIGPGGTVLAWGGNGSGELGDGSTTSRRTAVPVLVTAGGVLTVDATTLGGLPNVTTSTTDLGPCTVQVAHFESPTLVDVSRSPTGNVPASACLTVGGTKLRVTVNTSDGQPPPDVDWTPDPGTP